MKKLPPRISIPLAMKSFDLMDEEVFYYLNECHLRLFVETPGVDKMYPSRDKVAPGEFSIALPPIRYDSEKLRFDKLALLDANGELTGQLGGYVWYECPLGEARIETDELVKVINGISLQPEMDVERYVQRMLADNMSRDDVAVVLKDQYGLTDYRIGTLLDPSEGPNFLYGTIAKRGRRLVEKGRRKGLL